jgi:hypothetical protein
MTLESFGYGPECFLFTDNRREPHISKNSSSIIRLAQSRGTVPSLAKSASALNTDRIFAKPHYRTHVGSRSTGIIMAGGFYPCIC